jgi:hypothetical protein
LSALEQLLNNPLTVRIRRTWFGRTRGAIWVPDARGHGAWSGERGACRGKGREVTFGSNWYRKMGG